MNKLPDNQHLEPGGFYYDARGELWCCYRTDPDQQDQSRQACCVEVDTDTTDEFFLDGRHSLNRRYLSLVEKVSWVAGAK